jgi:hypothetical protein
MARHYMLSSEDLALINRRRGVSIVLASRSCSAICVSQGGYFNKDAATTGNFPKLIERLSLVRALGIEPERATRPLRTHAHDFAAAD